MNNIRLFAAAAALALGACAPAAPSAERLALAPSRTVITGPEIADAGGSDLYTVVQRLRPGWLTGRGVQNFGGRTGGVVVYLNHVRMGEVAVLREMAPEYVSSMRYLDATTSAGLPGIRPREIVAGAIVVYTPAGDPGAE